MIRLLAVCLLAASARAQDVPVLRGVVTDPSGAAVPGAVVQVRGRGGERHARTNSSGQYAFGGLAPGIYEVRIAAKGFATASKTMAIDAPAVLNARLAIRTMSHVVNVEGQQGA